MHSIMSGNVRCLEKIFFLLFLFSKYIRWMQVYALGVYRAFSKLVNEPKILFKMLFGWKHNQCQATSIKTCPLDQWWVLPSFLVYIQMQALPQWLGACPRPALGSSMYFRGIRTSSSHCPLKSSSRHPSNLHTMPSFVPSEKMFLVLNKPLKKMSCGCCGRALLYTANFLWKNKSIFSAIESTEDKVIKKSVSAHRAT